MQKVENGETYTLLEVSDLHNCFGCSPRNPQGMFMEFHMNEKKDSVMSWYTVPDHLCGWGEVVHGGIVSTMLDEAMGWACLYILQKLLLSKTLNVEFLKPVLTGKEIRVAGSVKSIDSERKAVMQGVIYDDANDLCARCSSTVSLFTLESIRKMGVLDERMLTHMEQSFDRI